MDDKLDDVWHSCDLPILREITRRIDAETNPAITRDEIATAVGAATAVLSGRAQ